MVMLSPPALLSIAAHVYVASMCAGDPVFILD